MKYVFITALVAFGCGVQVCAAEDAISATACQKQLRLVAAAELPVVAARLVQQAAAPQQERVAIEVVKAATLVNPAAAPLVVGSIAKAVPTMAATAAGSAAAQQPNLAAAIARAGAVAAPSEVEKIVTAVCRAVPHACRAVAQAVSEALPQSGKEVLRGIAAAVPSRKRGINDSLTSYTGNPVAVLDRLANNPGTGTAPLSRGPTIGPPYIPWSGSVGTIDPNTTTDVPPGGRDYAKP